MALAGNVYTGANLALSIAAVAFEQAALRSITINESKDSLDKTGGGGGPKTYIGGEQDGTMTIEMWSSDTDADVRTKFDLTDDDGVAVIVYPNGNTNGEPRISCSVIWTGITEGIEKNSVVPITATAQITGAITRDTVP
jgi:hypothetical protein